MADDGGVWTDRGTFRFRPSYMKNKRVWQSGRPTYDPTELPAVYQKYRAERKRGKQDVFEYKASIRNEFGQNIMEAAHRARTKVA